MWSPAAQPPGAAPPPSPESVGPVTVGAVELGTVVAVVEEVVDDEAVVVEVVVVDGAVEVVLWAMDPTVVPSVVVVVSARELAVVIDGADFVAAVVGAAVVEVGS